ncbi:MAG: hypothetical protein J6D44_14430 [Pseudomonas sp.]|nr:hypothetical protein [Pseudomonas sp.]
MMKPKESFETETFVDENGYYVIEQRIPHRCKVSELRLTPNQMRLLIADMEYHLKDLSWSEND